MVISLPFLDPTLDHIPRYLRYNLYLARMGLFVQGRRSPGDAIDPREILHYLFCRYHMIPSSFLDFSPEKELVLK
jgi:hypothetical protein